jgi:RsiW-degrading membrane proteinase PrsW (M82 family)
MISIPIISAVIASFLFAMFWIYVWRSWDRREPEPFWALFLSMFMGGMSAFVILIFLGTKAYLSVEHYLGLGLLLMIFSVIMEELLKIFAFWAGTRVYKKQVNQISDGLMYGAATALGFAFVENVIYFIDLNMDPGVVIFRSLDTMFAHALFTGIFAFYYVIAYNPMKIKNKKTPIAKRYKVSFGRKFMDIFKALRFHITFSHVLKHRKSQHQHRHTEVLFEGFWIATVFHFLHNFFAGAEFLGKASVMLMSILILGMLYFCLSIYDQKWYLRLKRKR